MSLNGAYALALQGLEEAIEDQLRVIQKRMDTLQPDHDEWTALNYDLAKMRSHLWDVQNRRRDFERQRGTSTETPTSK